MQIKANYVDIAGRKVYPSIVRIEEEKIASVERIDAHIHIECSIHDPIVHGTPGDTGAEVE